MKKDVRLKKFIKDNYAGYLAVLPLVLGIIIFYGYPVICSLIYSFHDYNLFRGTLGKVTLDNFKEMFTVNSSMFFQSLKITFVYTAVMVSVNMFFGFLIAFMTNRKSKAMVVYRLLLYLPCLIPTVVSGIIWQYVADPYYGIGNAILKEFKLPAYGFFNNPDTSLPSIIMFSCFGVTSSIFIWLSSLKSIPTSLYEAAEMEGCNGLAKLVYVTLPMCTPFIIYNLLTSVIGALQTFGSVFTITGGTAGMENSLLFLGIYIYKEAFSSFNISYASALSWVLFLITAVISGILLKTSKWVYYGEDV